MFHLFSTSPAHMKRLIILLTGLVIADGLVTEFMVRNGLGREGNPFLEGLVGEKAFLLLKVGGALLVAFLLWDMYKRWPKLAVFGASAMALCYSALVIWNLCVPLFVPR